MMRVGFFMNLPEDDSDVPNRKDAIRKGLTGFTEGKDVELAYRHGGGKHLTYDRVAEELVALDPDVLFASCGPSFWAVRDALPDAGKTKPIVFAGMIDAYSLGRVEPPRNQDENFCGYISYTTGLCPRWVEYLKRGAPDVKRVAVIRDTLRPAGMAQFHAIKAAAVTAGIDTVIPIEVGDGGDRLSREFAAFKAGAQGGNSGVIVPAGTVTATNRKRIIELAANLPSIYPNRMYVNSGAPMAYGAITLEIYEAAAGFIARILKGAKPAELGVVRNSNFELVINDKAAKAAGLDLAALNRPDRIQVIE
jgi:ABC-type uncharacterized transport system substrate-binding protein